MLDVWELGRGRWWWPNIRLEEDNMENIMDPGTWW
jgi:hypothetical protein